MNILNKHGTKIIAAAIIITIFLSMFYFIDAIVLYEPSLPDVIKIGGLVFSVIITILLIIVLVERIKEIKEGEDDDLGKY